MEILLSVLLFLHLLGMAIIVGGYLINAKSPRVFPGMFHAACLQLVTGIAMFGILEANHAGSTDLRIKLSIKFVLAVIVTVTAFLGNRQEKAAKADSAAVGSASAAGTQTAQTVVAPSATMAHLTFGAALLAVVVAVFWVG